MLVGIAVSPLAILIGLISAGAGHGAYLAAIALFPFTLASTYFLDAIPMPFLFLAAIQYPLYGWLVGRAMSRPNERWIPWAIGSAHFVIVMLLYFRPPDFLA